MTTLFKPYADISEIENFFDVLDIVYVAGGAFDDGFLAQAVERMDKEVLTTLSEELSIEEEEDRSIAMEYSTQQHPKYQNSVIWELEFLSLDDEEIESIMNLYAITHKGFLILSGDIENIFNAVESIQDENYLVESSLQNVFDSNSHILMELAVRLKRIIKSVLIPDGIEIPESVFEEFLVAPLVGSMRIEDEKMVFRVKLSKDTVPEVVRLFECVESLGSDKDNLGDEEDVE